ncbi:hypothetical protein [Maridesulfovibrio zosterae]|uniref:hypothetical protein n=1 Tax=Maridesulfovibrio zosterae TaxID=82171 RepID=UPI0004235373|nr:hypothetical protein [Maridesulfovibrio zosterae]
MANGKYEVEHFINTKVYSQLTPWDPERKRKGPSKKVRRKWNGHFIGVNRFSDISIKMFREIEEHLRLNKGWSPYGWAAKSEKIARRLYHNGVTSKEYTVFPRDQRHWNAFYCTRDLRVALGYYTGNSILMRIYIKNDRIDNIWSTGEMHLGRSRASAIMLAAKLREPRLKFFGITGPQSRSLREPETALFGSEIKQNTLCIPVPKSIDINELEQDRYFGGIKTVPIHYYHYINEYLCGLN